MNIYRYCNLIILLSISILFVGCKMATTVNREEPEERCPVISGLYNGHLGHMPVILDWSFDGTKIIHGVYNLDFNSELLLADLKQNDVTSLNFADRRIDNILSANFSPWANEILIENESDGNHSVFVISYDDLSSLKMIDQAMYPQWSPDGSKISYFKDSVWNILEILNENEISTDYEIPTSWWLSQQGFWHPDGNFVLLLKSGDASNSPNNLAMLDLSTSEITQLTNSVDCELAAQWSPQGDAIAYLGNPTGNRDIFLMNFDGSNQQNLTHSNPKHETEFSWSPDGKYIAFIALTAIDYDTDNKELYLLDVETKQISQLTFTEKVDEFYPVWSPNGERIAFFVEKDLSNESPPRQSFELFVLDLINDELMLINTIDIFR